jgi:hypothetical protein
MFGSKARAYPSEAPFHCSNVWLAKSLSHKNYTRLERPAKDKLSSLLQTFINGFKKFLILAPGWKSFPRTNALAYLVSSKVTKKVLRLSELVEFFSLSIQFDLCPDHFPGQLCRLGGINKDPTVRLDGARPPLKHIFKKRMMFD